MLVFLLFCFCGANFVHSQEDSGIITVSAEGNSSLPCDQSKLIPLKVKVLMGKDRNSWVRLELYSTFLEINTTKPSLSLPAYLSGNGSQTCSCYASNSSHPKRDPVLSEVTTYQEKNKYIYCNPTDEWNAIVWSQQDHLIAKVTRGETRVNIRVVVTEPLSITIFSVIPPDANQQKTLEKTVRLSCKTATGFQKFIEERYWIIVVTTLSYVLFCVTATCGYMTIRRRRKAEKRRKAQARFFKVSTARNLYMESINQEPANWKQDEPYQNFSPTKDSGDHFSNKSSFLDVSEGGDSYLEPMPPEETDQISDDVDCYENANEEIKEGSIGSQSYEDMNGPKNGQSLNPEKTREEDADSYENMQAPIYSQLNRSVNSLAHFVEDGVEQTGPIMADVSPEQQWPTSTELKQLNGDFYLSYQANNF